MPCDARLTVVQNLNCSTVTFSDLVHLVTVIVRGKEKRETERRDGKKQA